MVVQLRALKNDPIVKLIVVDSEIINNIISFGIEDLLLKKFKMMNLISF